MSGCEKCWRDASGDADTYQRLVKERKCTPEEQAGWAADICDKCNRKTRHQYTGECMACGHDPRFPSVAEGPGAEGDRNKPQQEKP